MISWSKSFVFFIIPLISIVGYAQEPVVDQDIDAKQILKLQAQLTQRIEDLEFRLLKLIDFESDRNPERVKVLEQGLQLAQSSELVSKQNKIRILLQKGGTVDLGQALSLQKEILENLNRLYELLESNDQLKSKRNEAEIIKQRIAKLNQILQTQQGIRQRLESANPVELKPEQLRAAQQVESLQKEIDSDSKSNGKPVDGKSGKENKSNETNNPPSKDQKPIDHLHTAKEQMNRAADSLTPENKTKAQAEMQAAEKALELAKDKLEKKLRQNREEEIESTLRSLEERLKSMLQLQSIVNKSSQDLVDAKKDLAEFRIEAFKLSGKQKEIITELEKTLLVLAEEGTSRSIPGTLFHLKLDMLEVAAELADANLSKSVIDLQREILDVLSELVEAVQKERSEQNALKQGSPPANTGQPQRRPLVQKIAELKIIRQLQVRINKRHQSYAKSLKENISPESIRSLEDKTRKLAVRQKQLETLTLEMIQEEID